VGVRIERHAVHLDYARDGKPEHVELRLQCTSYQYGGDRPWFTCPRCNIPGHIQVCLPSH
jgi:hypothetical protein